MRLNPARGLLALGAIAGVTLGGPAAEAVQPSPLATRLPVHVAVVAQQPATVDLHDEVAVRVEAARLRALIDAVTTPAGLTKEEGVLWRARLALDRARLAILELPAAKRAALNTASSPPTSVPTVLTPAATVLQPPPDLENEAAKLVTAERLRLKDFDAGLAVRETTLAKGQAALSERRDEVLGWQRRTREVQKGARQADPLYDALRVRLRDSRKQLAAALTAARQPGGKAPDIGPDPLVDLPAGPDTTAVRLQRDEVLTRLIRLQDAEQTLQSAQLSQMMDEVSQLNRARLDLLSRLSSDKLSSITGFTPAAWDQAWSELRQLWLVARYRQYEVAAWFTTARGPDFAYGRAFFGMVFALFPEMLLLGLFLWWRRQSDPILEQLVERQDALDRKSGLATTGTANRGLRYLRAIHKPLQAFLAFGLAHALLPAGMRSMIEVESIGFVLQVVLLTSVVIAAIDALFAAETIGHTPLASGSDDLRARSLRLIGRVVIVFWLVLGLTEMVLGHGTIFGWVASTCWLAALPIFAQLVRWWRPLIFERSEARRHGGTFRTWVLASQKGWVSYPAAALAGIYLLATGMMRFVRYWVGSFALARRAHAYLFRRQLEQRQREHPGRELRPLAAHVYEALDPAKPSATWIDESSKTWELITQHLERGHGLLAVVGERGAGKSELLRRATEGFPTAVIVDDVGHMVRPYMGGLAAFDDFMVKAREGAVHTAWVVSINQAIWPFIEKARGERPSFDAVIQLKPWTETDIEKLLTERSAEAGISPRFDELVDISVVREDEEVMRDAVAASRTGYFRLIWDYADGNPAVALEVWRESLEEDEAGETFVRHMATPDAHALERLSDIDVFVLKALMQLAPGTTAEVQTILRGTPVDVDATLRYSEQLGVLENVGEGRRIRMRWHRAVSRMVQRRHMVVR